MNRLNLSDSRPVFSALLISGFLSFWCPPDALAQVTSENKPQTWLSLFDGRTMSGWKSSEFGADGPVQIVDGAIRLGFGEPLTGVTYDGQFALPEYDYQLKLRARRIDGMDFFCGLTFPYGETHCTLILGGWGGGVIGLSSLDGRDASENETTRYESFKRNEWYDVRVQVKRGSIVAWINGRQRVICNVADRKVTTRPEVIRSRPLGIASFRTKAEIKDIAIRLLSPKSQTSEPPKSDSLSVPDITSRTSTDH
jgi:hypothetical protein